MKNTQHNLLQTLLIILMLCFAQSIMGQVDILRDNALVNKGEQVCIDHVVEGWDDLISATFGVGWDPAVLQFDGVTNIAPDLSTSTFNENETSQGKLYFLWAENPNSGLNLGDGQVIFTVCFTAIGEPGQESKIQVTGTNNNPPIEFLDSNFENVSLGRAFDSFVTIELDTIPEDALILYYDDIVVQSGAPICVPIRVRNFTDIFSLSFSMDFNTVRFDYTGRTFAETLNGTWQVNNSASTQTQIQYSGFDSFSNSGLNMADGTRLIEICFDQTGQSSCINEELFLSPNPIQILAQRVDSDGDPKDIHVYLEEGNTIKVFTPIDYNGENITPTNCSGANVGAISVDASGGTDQIKYLWSNGETTSTISNLAAGTYNVSISDVCLAVDTIFKSYVVPVDGNVPNADAGVDMEFNCDIDKIILDGTGSDSGNNISYEWKVVKGQLITVQSSTVTAEATKAGIYELVVTDTNSGCTERDTVVVTDTRDIIPVMVSGDVALTCDDVSIRIFGNGPSAAGYEYSWSTDDGSILNEISPGEIEINRPGTYTFTVSNNNTGCAERADIIVSGDNVPPDVDINGTATISCSDPQLNLDANLVAVSGVSYVWSTTDGSIVSGDNTLTVTVDAPGTYKVTATSASGCTASDEQVVIDGRSMPMASAGPARAIGCDDENIILQGTGSIGAGYTYNWTTVDGNILAQMPNGEATIDLAGTYTFTVLETINGCSTSSDVTVTGGNVKPLANISGASVLDCNTPSIELNANNGGAAVDGYTYSWNTTDGVILNGVDQVIAQIDQPGTYMVEVTNSANGCMDSSVVSVVAELDDPVITSSADDAIGCSTEVKTLTATSDNMANMTFQWTALDGMGQILSSSTGSEIEVRGADRYEVVVTNALTGCASSAQTIISLNGALVGAQVGMDYDHCDSETTLMGNMENGVTGLWTVVTGGATLEDPVDSNSLVSNLGSGVNTFVWTLSTSGCLDYSSDTININFTPAPIALNDKYDVIQGFDTIDIDLLANDQYSMESGATIMLTSQPSQGTLTETSNGQFRYKLDDPDLFGVFTFEYEICDDLCSLNCDTGTVTIDVRDSSLPPIDAEDLKEPRSLGITPNGDGLNDLLVFDELFVDETHFKTRRLLIYNRWGDIIHESMPYNNDWGGTDAKGGILPQGTYYFVLQLDLGQGIVIEGDITILK